MRRPGVASFTDMIKAAMALIKATLMMMIMMMVIMIIIIIMISLRPGNTGLMSSGGHRIGREILFSLGWQSFQRWCFVKNTGVEAP